MVKNAFNLSREIPKDIKRTVRRNCGFGCVICGLWIYEYEHIDPLFSEATQHDPTKMCLLCPNHHTEVTKGILSKEEVTTAANDPFALRKGFSHHNNFSRLRRPVSVFLGPILFINPREVLRIDDELILSVADDLDEGPLKLNGKIFDRNSDLILEIIDNEWRAFTENWDVEQKGNSIIMREKLRKISLTVCVQSSDILIFDNVHIYYHGAVIQSKYGKSINITTSQNGGKIENADSIMTGGPIVLDTKSGKMEIRGGCNLSFFVRPKI